MIMIELARWMRVALALAFLLLPATAPRAGEETQLIGELEQHRQQILLRIEDLKALQKQSELSLERAKSVRDLAARLDDRAALNVATEAIAKAQAAIDGVRGELRTEYGNLVRVDHFLDQKEKISFSDLKTRVLVRRVPNPMQLPRGSWLRYVRSDRANLIIDALEHRNGDLDEAIRYLDDQIIKFGGNRNSESALSYLEGLRTSYIAADAEYRKFDQGDGAPVSIESRALMDAITRDTSAYTWPGPKNPNPGDTPLNKHDWRVQRADKMLSAMQETPDDLAKTYQSLADDKDIFAAANARNYLKGAFAYWDYLGTTSAK